jgi:hypothetical protein
MPCSTKEKTLQHKQEKLSQNKPKAKTKLLTGTVGLTSTFKPAQRLDGKIYPIARQYLDTKSTRNHSRFHPSEKLPGRQAERESVKKNIRNISILLLAF